jgi:hypothetical protein
MYEEKDSLGRELLQDEILNHKCTLSSFNNFPSLHPNRICEYGEDISIPKTVIGTKNESRS